jgi:hypothetical protein
MVKKDPAQCDASAGIYTQVAALGLELRELANQWLGGRDSIVHLDTPTK